MFPPFIQCYDGQAWGQTGDPPAVQLFDELVGRGGQGEGFARHLAPDAHHFCHNPDRPIKTLLFTLAIYFYIRRRGRAGTTSPTITK